MADMGRTVWLPLLGISGYELRSSYAALRGNRGGWIVAAESEVMRR